MPREFEMRPGETYEEWWHRVNEVAPDPYPAGTIVAEVSR